MENICNCGTNCKCLHAPFFDELDIVDVDDNLMAEFNEK